MEKISAKEESFCRHYCQLHNPREAAVRAGYPPETAEEEGTKLLEKREIKRRLLKLAKDGEAKDLQSLAVAGLTRLAFGSAADCVKLLLLYPEMESNEIQKLDLFLLSEVKKTKDGGMELKLFDRFKALEKLLSVPDAGKGDEGLNSFYQAMSAAGEQLEEAPDE